MTDRPKCILWDPPWAEYGGGKRGAQNHYGLLGLGEIAKVAYRAAWPDGSPVFDPAPSAHLWTWATDNFLLDALSLIDQVGFRYVRAIVWVKLAFAAERDVDHLNGPDLARATLQIGLGQYARGAHELLLFATRGRAMVPLPEHRPPSVIFAPRTEHSAKPAEAYEAVERISPGPRVELFARTARPGWRAWGDQAPIGDRDASD